MITPAQGHRQAEAARGRLASRGAAFHRRSASWLILSLLPALVPVLRAESAPALGLFTGHTDIGAPKRAGTVAYDASKGTYTIGGGGVNMWFKADSFHFVWKKVEGDVALAADIAFPDAGGNAHRKGVLMIRQTLDADSSYADAALHGDGLTSLQFRETAGDVTHEVQTVIKAPARLRLEKIGDYIYMSLAGTDKALTPSGSSVRLPFKGPFYIGLGVCAHDEGAFETAAFSNVVLGAPSAEATTVRSSVEYVKVPSGDRVCVHSSSEAIFTAGWTPDGAVYFSQKSGTFRVPATGGPAETVDPAVLPSGPQAYGSPDRKWRATLEHQGADAVLTLQSTAGGESRVLMRLSDQADAPVAISWSSDSTKISYVRYQPAPKASPTTPH